MQKPDTRREILALVSMMDEPDPKIFSDISGKILHHGQEALPYLELEFESVTDDFLRSRIEALMNDIRHDTVFRVLQSAIGGHGQDDLLKAWLGISKYHYPGIAEEEILEKVDAIRKDVWLEVNDNLTALEQVKVFNHVFYGLHGFRGNIENYHSPDNIFINRVLMTMKGNPLSIGLLYMLVAHRADIPVMGINLPEHFVLAYMGETIDTESLRIRDDQPLFYIDAFSNGNVFSAREINDFLDKLGHEPLPGFFSPCSNKEIIIRMLNNLVVAYDHTGEYGKKDEIQSLIDRLNQVR